MERINEIQNLIDSYIQRIKKLNLNISWAISEELIHKLTLFKTKCLQEQNTNEEWFQTEIVNAKSSAGQIFEKLNSIDDDIRIMGIRIRNLVTNTRGNQIQNSNAHYKPLINHATPQLFELGYLLIESKDNNKFYNPSNQIELSIVYQRYDPPEVWIKKRTDNNYVRIDNLFEKYFLGNNQILDKHSGEDGLYFNYSKFDYFSDLLISIKDRIEQEPNFVNNYRNWIKEISGQKDNL